jgi:hypothetical protein
MSRRKNDNQPEFFVFNGEGEAYARTPDPDTSHAAATSVRGDQANRLELEILEVLKRHPAGLTNHEIVEASGVEWNTATPRIAPLVRKGLVIDSGRRRTDPSTGRACNVWQAL